MKILFPLAAAAALAEPSGMCTGASHAWAVHGANRQDAGAFAAEAGAEDPESAGHAGV